MIARLNLTLARYFLTLWVGGAILFVITSIAEQRYPGFEASTKNQLALIRFPWYYRFGFGLVGATLASGHFARKHRDLHGRRRWVVVGCLSAALVVMLIDYYSVFVPLQVMLTPPNQVIPADFERFHQLSKWLNFSHVGLAAIAALVLCIPASDASGTGCKSS